MASLGHVAIGLAAGRFLGGRTGLERTATRGWMIWFSMLSLLPDADVIAFRLGIPYGAPWGHRGASHSIVLGSLAGLSLGLIAARSFRTSALATALLSAAVVASHGLLDALTDGGLGIALGWPFTNARYFAPWRPIPVAPIGLSFLGRYGLAVAATEALYFLPLFYYALRPARRSTAAPEETEPGRS